MPAAGDCTAMRWFRLRQRWGTCLALAALVVQLVVASGHIHLDPADHHHRHVAHAGLHGDDAAVAAAAHEHDAHEHDPSGVPAAPDHEPVRGLRADPTRPVVARACRAGPGAAERDRASACVGIRHGTDGTRTRALPGARTSFRLTLCGPGRGAPPSGPCVSRERPRGPGNGWAAPSGEIGGLLCRPATDVGRS